MDLENLKDHIKDIELDFDQKEVWANIQREQKKEKKRIFFWWSSIFVGLLFVVGLYHILDSIIFRSSELENQEVTQNLSIEQQNIESINSEIKNDKISVTNVNTNIESIENEEQLSSVADNDLQVNRTKVPLSKVNTSINSILKIKKPTTNFINSKEEVSDLFSIVNKRVDDQENFSEDLDNYLILADSSNDSFDVMDEDLFIKEEKSTDLTTKFLSMNSIPSLDFSQLNYIINVNPPKNQFSTYLLGTDEVQTEFKREVSLVTIAQYGKLLRNLRSKDDNNLALTNREESETVLDHSIVGLQINIPITHQFFVTSGIEYNRMATKLEFGSTSVRPLALDGLQGQSGFAISNSNSKFYNHIDLVNVPLLVGARWNQSRWSETLSVGTSINLYSSNRQLYLDEWNSLSDNTNNVKSKFNNSYILRAGLGYEFWSQFEWSVYASYRYTPNVMNNDSNYSQSYQTYLLGTGIHYKF